MLQEAVEKLAAERLILAARSQRVKELDAELKATPKGQELIDAHALLSETRSRINALEQLVRGEAIACFKGNGDKHPVPGIGIRVGEALTYDQERALKYCRRKVQNALRFDKREFEKVARVLRPKWVTFEPKVTATIARDLSGVLAKARKEAEGEER
jgi:hypothetical protein